MRECLCVSVCVGEKGRERAISDLARGSRKWLPQTVMSQAMSCSLGLITCLSEGAKKWDLGKVETENEEPLMSSQP